MSHSLVGLLPRLEAPDAAATSRNVDESSPVLRPFVAPLVVSYVVDAGDSDRVFLQRDLLASGLDVSRLHEQALENLTRHVRAEGIRLRSYGSMMAVQFDGDMEATLMLYPTLWAQLCEEMGDELVVAVPARDVLAVSPLESLEGIGELHAVIQRVWPRDDHPLTTELFQFSAGEWRVWEAPSP